MKPIIWEPKKVAIESLKENPQNPKIINEQGKERLHKSLTKFGLAGTIVVNKDLSIIDGHSRKIELIEAGVKEVWVSVPSRQLTEKEYNEFNAIFDVAKAGEADMFMIENILSEEELEEWGFNENGETTKKSKNDSDAKYPLVPQYDEKHEAIVILCHNSLDTTFIKNALGIEKAMSYKNKMVKETSVVTADQFIKKWKSKS